MFRKPKRYQALSAFPLDARASVTSVMGIVLSVLPPAAGAQGANAQLLVNVKTGKCLTIAGGVSSDNNLEAVQFDCDDHPSRTWILKKMSVGTYQIRNVQTGKCLTIAGGVSTENNVSALQFDCDSHPSRTWRLTQVGSSGDFQVRNTQTQKCLTIAGGVSTDNNVRALQFNCDADLSRRWSIRLKP